ncbi:hypothetical protein ADUPG1_009600 [Aduncisulcus paluster]|uniref:HMG box domain-containing protein n=1 Tax=Aduncisulcus paluster TaxID=2918883 RepID=A0ABQ5KW42_9EUKA|nr:hypothetical protein ADUPG1_009600 [Aduncisulcus paluster]
MTEVRAPKRPLNSYMRWTAKNRADIKKKFPQLRAKEFTSKLGELYANIPAVEKESYAAEYKKDMEKWKKEMDAFKKANPDFVPAKKGKKVPSASVLTGFALFYGCELVKMEVKEEKTISKGTAMKKIVKKWNALSESQIKKYDEVAKRTISEGVIPKKRAPSKKKVEVEKVEPEEKPVEESSQEYGEEYSSSDESSD